MLTDPIADMLSRIRNANRAMHDTVSMPTVKMAQPTAEQLKRQDPLLGGLDNWEADLETPKSPLRPIKVEEDDGLEIDL